MKTSSCVLLYGPRTSAQRGPSGRTTRYSPVLHLRAERSRSGGKNRNPFMVGTRSLSSIRTTRTMSILSCFRPPAALHCGPFTRNSFETLLPELLLKVCATRKAGTSPKTNGAPPWCACMIRSFTVRVVWKIFTTPTRSEHPRKARTLLVMQERDSTAGADPHRQKRRHAEPRHPVVSTSCR
jgi:hypothetical protein